MSRESDSVADIRARLQAAGYRLVQLDRKLDDTTNYRADALAYATNADGDLVPWIVVEAKNGPHAKPNLALPYLLKARDVLGTVEHYAVINGQWFRADRSLRSFEPVDGPEAPAYGDHGWVVDPSLATTLLTDRLWFEADRTRGLGGRIAHVFPTVDLLAESSIPGIETAGGEFVPVRPDVLWQSRRRALASFVSRAPSAAEHTTAQVIADAVARLLGNRLGGTLLDPFCGTGNFLWSAVDRALESNARVKLVGQEINAELADLAAQIARTAPMPATITAGDSFAEPLPMTDAIVTAPPFGPHLMRPWTLLDGSRVRGCGHRPLPSPAATRRSSSDAAS